MADITIRRGSASLEITGINDLFKVIDSLGGNIIEVAKRVFADGAERLLQASHALVPEDTGDLKDSGVVWGPKVKDRGPFGGAIITAGVSYGGFALSKLNDDRDAFDMRAVMAHEDLSASHESGQAKFLEQPAAAINAQILDDLRAEIARLMANGGKA